MAKAKKALSLILAAVMLMGVMSLISFAADAPAGQEATISFSYDKGSYAAGETVTLTVKLTSNYFVAPAAIPVEFDAAAATYTGTGGVTGGALFGSVAATETAAFLSDGLLYVALTPRASQNAVAQQCADVLLFTATFTANTAISDPTKVFGVLDDQKTMSNLSGKLFVGSYETADITSTVYATGQTLNYPTRVVGGNPELILTELGATAGAVIDKARCTTSGEYAGCIYGIATLAEEPASIADYVTTQFGSVNVVVNENGFESTGATIQLLNTDGSVLETYVFVYFGDINGDGAVDIADAGAVEAHDAWMETIDEDIAAFYAADVVPDGVVDIADAGAIEAADAWIEPLPPQSELAAIFTLM